MVAHCFREKKKRPGGVEKNCSDHFNANVQRTTVLRNATGRQALKLTSSAGQHAIIFCLAKSAQYALHDRVSMNAIGESLPLRSWTQSTGEEVANGISHGIGLVGAM